MGQLALSPSSMVGPTASAYSPKFSIEAEPKPSLLFWSGLIAATIPVALAVYWFAYRLAPDGAGFTLRLVVLFCAALLAFLWHGAPSTHAEILLMRVLSAAGLILLLSALMATDPRHAVAGWIKSLVLFAFCYLLARGLRHRPTAETFGIALLCGGGILIAFILYTHVHSLGFVIPSFKTARELKGIQEAEGVSLNSIAFAAVLSYLMGLCLIGPGRKRIGTGVFFFIVAAVFSGSRAPLSMLAATGFVLLCVNGLRSRFLLIWVATVMLIACAIAGVVLTVMLTPDATLTKATEGRWHLWFVGLHKFAERPLFGYGYESWRDDLVSRLPGEYELTLELASKSSGAYHNQYVGVLAEEGLNGVAAAALIVWLVIRTSWLLAFREWRTVTSKQLPLFVCTFLLLRANFEVPGLFGYGQDPVDYLAYIFVAILISRFSIEEDSRAKRC